jgi:hypothetical protein
VKKGKVKNPLLRIGRYWRLQDLSKKAYMNNFMLQTSSALVENWKNDQEKEARKMSMEDDGE